MANEKPSLASVQDLSISPGAANLYALGISLPLAALLVTLYGLFSPKSSSLLQLPSAPDLLLFMVALILGIIAHEIIHGLGWAYLGRMPLRRIRFGFHARTMTPYAHALDPMPAKAYRIGAALPGLVLGALPFVSGTVCGTPWLALFGTVFSLAAGGDLLVLWLIRKVEANAMVHDHPSRAGCLVVTSKGE